MTKKMTISKRTVEQAGGGCEVDVFTIDNALPLKSLTVSEGGIAGYSVDNPFDYGNLDINWLFSDDFAAVYDRLPDVAHEIVTTATQWPKDWFELVDVDDLFDEED